MKVDNLGMVYDDPVVTQAVLKQTPFALDAKSKAAISLKHIVSRLEGIDFKGRRRVGNFLSKP